VTGEAPGASAEIDAITPIVQPLIPMARTVTLTLTKKLARGLITVNDGDPACAQKVPAVLERRSRGWRRVASGVTDSAGRFRIRFRGGGVYRVRASETLRAGGRCLAAVSPVRRR
jgi:hypothetical protein